MGLPRISIPLNGRSPLPNDNQSLNTAFVLATFNVNLVPDPRIAQTFSSPPWIADGTIQKNLHGKADMAAVLTVRLKPELLVRLSPQTIEGCPQIVHSKPAQQLDCIE